ncbi:unnamed protein product [Prunus armeniaca]|uniref:Myb/SANT-like domain-containing protein n=1 Tax=Prunus armeniaca TaxID=36596 RepID=A0A6J5TJ67_PRUAR|nr:unnamed protein product [Prunus armeniaca]
MLEEEEEMQKSRGRGGDAALFSSLLHARLLTLLGLTPLDALSLSPTPTLQLQIYLLRMESEGNSQNFEQGKKGTRQSWPKFEEDAFLTMLDDFVAVGQRCETGLKACPHIESKLKKWKKQYSIVYDMHHKEAAEWRSKPFPLFDTLSNIFGKDHANGRRAEVPADMMEEQSNNEVNASDYCVQEDASPVSLNKEGSQSMNS